MKSEEHKHPTVPATLRKYGVKPSKIRGQHFLINEAISHRIVAAADISEKSTVIEIGAGTGALTRFLTNRAGNVIAVEIDRKLAHLLNCEFADCDNLTILNRNVLDLDLTELAASCGAESMNIVSNLPYNITGPVLDLLITHRKVIREVVIMIQLEVGSRLVAKPGTKSYGILSIVMPYYYRIESLFNVAGGNFMPRPDVESAVLKLTPLDKPPVAVNDPTRMFRLVKDAFQQRRKMLHHAVRRHAPDGVPEIIERTGIDLKRRGETLTMQEFAALSDAIDDFQ